jgi:NIMA (never in mitosis gene a)-related kinase
MVEKASAAKQYETYKKVSTLGTGSFGTAYLVECQSNKEYAVIKQIDIQSMSDEERKETLREAKILEVLNHPNIIRFREVYKTKKGKLCIVMDYADNGDLQTKIKDKHKNKRGGVLEHFAEDQVLNWFTQICLALKHCHDRKILHRDLKS